MNLQDSIRLIGATMRITRLIVADDVPGQWWIKDPIDRAMNRYERDNTRVVPAVSDRGHLYFQQDSVTEQFDEPWWWQYRDGLECPWCVSVHVALWLTAAEMVTAALPGPVRKLWEYVTGALALSEYATALGLHIDGYGEATDE